LQILIFQMSRIILLMEVTKMNHIELFKSALVGAAAKFEALGRHL